jgi:hypothetical protein
MSNFFSGRKPGFFLIFIKMNIRLLIENELQYKKIEDAIEKRLKGKHFLASVYDNGSAGLKFVKILYVTYDPEKTISLLVHVRVIKPQEMDISLTINRDDITHILTYFSIEKDEWAFTEF